METLANQLGYNDQKTQLENIIKTNGQYIARGHYAPNADYQTQQLRVNFEFIDLKNCMYLIPIDQDATFHFGNAAPQWQTFNNGHWKQLEKKVRYATFFKTQKFSY